MQGCWDHCDRAVRGLVSLRWCEEHQVWVVAAWAKEDGDHPFVDVHPMWQEPREIADDAHTDGTLTQLLTAVRRTVRRLADESRSGQQRLW